MSNVLWFKLGYIVNWMGSFTALLAVLGYLTWTNKPEEASRVGLRYLLFSVAALILFGSNLYVLHAQFFNIAPRAAYAIGASFLGLMSFIAATLSGWGLAEIPSDFEEFIPHDVEQEGQPVETPPVKMTTKPVQNYKAPPGLLHS